MRRSGSAVVGAQPDSITIAPNGQYAVVANEAEAAGVGQNGGSESLSIVDLTGFNGSGPGTLIVTNLPLASAAGVAGLSVNRTDDLGLLPIDNTPDTLEPESVAFSPDSRFAYITLQENNGVIRMERQTQTLTIVGLGTVLHEADVVNGGGYVPTPGYAASREPNGIAVDRTGRFFVTADEGDTRDATGSGSPRGGRTVSVFDARTGAFIADTGLSSMMRRRPPAHIPTAAAIVGDRSRNASFLPSTAAARSWRSGRTRERRGVDRRE